MVHERVLESGRELYLRRAVRQSVLICEGEEIADKHRRNGTVDEYSLHKTLLEPNRSFKFPGVSGPVSAVRAMPNGRTLIWYVASEASSPILPSFLPPLTIH